MKQTSKVTIISGHYVGYIYLQSFFFTSTSYSALHKDLS